MKIYKIHIPPVPVNLMIGELRNILVAGVTRNQRTQHCDDVDEADYIFLDFRHLQDADYSVSHPEKTIIIDYRDNQHPLFPDRALRYFKRSVVNTQSGRLLTYNREVIPISYCVKQEYFGLNAHFKNQRDIDIAVFFDPNETPDKARNFYRSRVTQLVNDRFRHLNIFVGIAGYNGELGRSGFQKEYFGIMARSKIVVTCNPDRWHGDYRLFEALSSGSLVLVDKMSTPVVHPFIDHEHLVYYDRNNLDTLINLINMFLSEPLRIRREAIANNGFEYAMKFHTVGSRIDEVLEKIV